MTLTDVLLSPLMATEPGRPRITYYDDATGERVELSTTTLANWAAKTANLLRDELDVQPGTRVAVHLPAHWQTAAVLLGIWWCGAAVLLDGDSADSRDRGTGAAAADVVLVDAGHLDLLDDRPSAALSLDFFGRGLPGLPVGVVDFATEVRLQPDDFTPWQTSGDTTPALGTATMADVLSAIRSRVVQLGLTASDRVLSTCDWSDEAGLRDGLLVVLAAGASLVHCRNPDPARLAARRAGEKITVELPVTGQGRR